MDFGYSSLKNAEMEGVRLGRWRDKPVFAASRISLLSKGTGAFYVVYDDENMLVEKTYNGTWYAYGTVSKSGNVSEFDERCRYWVVEKATAAEEKHAVCGKSAKECDGTAAETAAEVMGDVKLGLDVDATLKMAREITIDSLLEGFNYGLD